MTIDTPRGRRVSCETFKLNEKDRKFFSRLHLEINLLFQSSTAVANARYRRSQSTGAERWVDHHAANEVPLNTILKPSLKGSKRSVTRLSEKEIFHEKTSKYCLTTQEQDTDGEVETKLFKVS